VKQAFRILSLGSVLGLGALHGQTPTITAVYGEAGPKSTLCPGGIAFIQGTNLGGAGTVVTVGGKQAYVFSGGSTSLQLELPVNAALGATTLTAGTSAPFSITLVQYSPGLVTDGLADDLANAFHYPSMKAVTTTYPASPSEQIAVAATGLGVTNPVYATGTSPSNNNAVVTTLPTVTVAGKSATVATAFLEQNNPGFYLVVFTVPSGATAGNQNLALSIGGLSSNTTVLPVAVGPIISSVTSGASYNDPSLPNGPIAQGSIAVIQGNNLGPATLVVAQSAFQNTSLNTTSVSITISGTTVAALMY